MIYLDNAGSQLINQEWLKDVQRILSQNVFGNPHSLNVAGQNSKKWIEETRELILNFCGTSSKDYYVIFTQNATHALKIVGEYFKWDCQTNFYMTCSNHNSVVGIREYAYNKDSMINIVDNSFNIINTFSNGKSSKIFTKSLVALPAECNFSGKLTNFDQLKKNIDDIKTSEDEQVYLLLDCAKYISTNRLDLSKIEADFVPISLYKISGYPTNLGALLVKKSSANVLQKTYFGGGTYDLAIAEEHVSIPRKDFVEQFEDGSLGYLSIVEANICLKKYIETVNFERIKGMVQTCYNRMIKLEHHNGRRLVQFYGVDDIANHGSILAFNLITHNGEYYGYKDVQMLADKADICLRVGCFCNPGACSQYLGLTKEDLLYFFKDGHRCWDSKDIINGKITGAIRISFGYTNTLSDIDKWIKFLEQNYVSKRVLEEEREYGNPQLTKIVIYPIKSCLGQEVDEWPICHTGLKYDRMFAIFDKLGRSITLKRNVKLGKIRPEVILEKDEMVLEDVQLQECIKFKIQNFEKSKEFINEWLSQKIEEDCEMVLSQSSQKNFANTNQYLVISKTSLQDLNMRIMLDKSWMYYFPEWIKKSVNFFYQPIQWDRFRPNLIIDNLPAYEEDKIKRIECNGVTIVKEGDCNRCYLTTMNPNKQEQDHNLEPMRTLNKYRKMDGKTIFGALFSNENTCGILKTGNIKIDL